ncbi:BTB/POZ domain-containing protein [Hibiscus syriacus]|uniref:BTB/POZ domain-containing protein n=1 Tax=Hibiscus syriacus TaxID=106335 RepID=A0A6A2YWU0_HIBSY|nr:BTB/POZ domain-containing protein [Hibiscus syriacus]
MHHLLLSLKSKPNPPILDTATVNKPPFLLLPPPLLLLLVLMTTPLSWVLHGVLSRKLDSSTIVSPDNSRCCPSSKPLSTPPPSPPQVRLLGNRGGTMLSNGHSLSSFNKFNSALTAGLLNPMSHPPPADKTRSSPTLSEMMASEPDIHERTRTQNQTRIQVPNSAPRQNQTPPVIDKQVLTMQRISYLLSTRSPGNQFNEPGSSDIKLTLTSKDGLSVSLNMHRQILVAHSRFFAVRLSDRWTMQQRNGSAGPYIVEITDCDDVEVSATIGFDAGVLSCLEYLEAVPWAEDEEEKVASLLAELRLENVGAGEVLKRVSVEVTNGTDEDEDNEQVLLKLLHVVLEGKDEKARCEMKRYEISRVTARLFVGIGKEQLLASKEVRCLLLRTWLVPFYDDFGWMRRTSKGLNQHLIEDHLNNTILTLPMAWQQEILLAWFNRFLNSGEDCPNIQKGFEVWWRRAFWQCSGEREPPRPIRVATAAIEN